MPAARRDIRRVRKHGVVLSVPRGFLGSPSGRPDGQGRMAGRIPAPLTSICPPLICLVAWRPERFEFPSLAMARSACRPSWRRRRRGFLAAALSALKGRVSQGYGMVGLGSLARKLFGSPTTGGSRAIGPASRRSTRWSRSSQALSDDQLRARTDEFRASIADGDRARRPSRPGLRHRSRGRQARPSASAISTSS